MKTITCNINGKNLSLDVDPQMPLLRAIRDVVGLKSTEYDSGVVSRGTSAPPDGQDGGRIRLEKQKKMKAMARPLPSALPIRWGTGF